MKKILLYTILGIGGLALTASCSRDEGPTDTMFDFELPVINQTAEYPVGVFYTNPGSNGQDATRYERMLELWDEDNGTAGPGLEPVCGNMSVNQNESEITDEMIAYVQQQVDWCIDGGVDFLILPALTATQNKVAPDCIGSNIRLYNIIRGTLGSYRASDDPEGKGTNSGPKVDMKSLKFCATLNMEDPICKSTWKGYDADGNELASLKTLANTYRLEDDDDNGIYASYIPPVTDEDGNVITAGYPLTRRQVFFEFFKSLKSLFEDSHYFRVGGTRPMVVLQNAHKLYSVDCQAFYAELKAVVKEATGEDIYIVAQQEGSWNPPARGEYFFRGVDAITNLNMYNNNNWSRSVDYPRMIYLNWEYNREYIQNNWNMDFIPTGSPAFNGYVDNGNTDKPIVKHDPETFRTMCNVMKSQAGHDRIVFIDSFNNFQYCSFLEPTKEDYGNGFGTKMLQVVKDEFDVR